MTQPITHPILVIKEKQLDENGMEKLPSAQEQMAGNRKLIAYWQHIKPLTGP